MRIKTARSFTLKGRVFACVRLAAARARFARTPRRASPAGGLGAIAPSRLPRRLTKVWRLSKGAASADARQGRSVAGAAGKQRKHIVDKQKSHGTALRLGATHDINPFSDLRYTLCVRYIYDAICPAGAIGIYIISQPTAR